MNEKQLKIIMEIFGLVQTRVCDDFEEIDNDHEIEDIDTFYYIPYYEAFGIFDYNDNFIDLFNGIVYTEESFLDQEKERLYGYEVQIFQRKC